MVAFALSCFGILIFLWLSFGGSVPLQPQGYRINAQFPEATQLAQEAEVRISGVKVGKVRRVQPDNQTGLTDTVLEIDARYAPLAKDTRAILRQKTLLGETYVELAPGSKSSGTIPDGGDLPEGQVADTVQLDEILRTFDPEDPRALLRLARPAGPRGPRQRRGDQRRPGQPHAVCREHRRRAEGAEGPGHGHEQADPQHRRGVRRPVPASGSAALADPQLQHRLGHHRPPNTQLADTFRSCPRSCARAAPPPPA